MVKRLVIYLALLTNSCGTINVGHVDPNLRPYLNRFIEEAKKQDATVDIDGLGMKFDHLETDKDNTIGLCEQTDSWHIVSVDINFWNRSTDESREEIVFHELGHCLLHRPHCNTADKYGAVSLMNASIQWEWLYDKRRSYFLAELFHPFPGCPTHM